ncbi:MAG: copper resistance CopC family protein [Pseudohongiellaceae bacterium]
MLLSLRIPLKTGLIKLCSLGLLAGLCSMAFAHTGLTDAAPAADATVSEAPKEIVLNFNGQVNLVKFELLDGTGRVLKSGFEPPLPTQETFVIAAPLLQAGEYTVNWAVVGADGHTVADRYSFTIDPAAATGHSQDHEQHTDHSAHQH